MPCESRLLIQAPANPLPVRAPRCGARTLFQSARSKITAKHEFNGHSLSRRPSRRLDLLARISRVRSAFCLDRQGDRAYMTPGNKAISSCLKRTKGSHGSSFIGGYRHHRVILAALVLNTACIMRVKKPPHARRRKEVSALSTALERKLQSGIRRLSGRHKCVWPKSNGHNANNILYQALVISNAANNRSGKISSSPTKWHFRHDKFRQFLQLFRRPFRTRLPIPISWDPQAEQTPSPSSPRDQAKRPMNRPVGRPGSRIGEQGWSVSNLGLERSQLKARGRQPRLPLLNKLA